MASTKISYMNESPKRRLPCFSSSYAPTANPYKRLKSGLLTSLEVRKSSYDPLEAPRIMTDLGCFTYSSSSTQASIDLSRTNCYIPTDPPPSTPPHKSPVLNDIQSYLPRHLSISSTSTKGLILSKSHEKLKSMKPKIVKLFQRSDDDVNYKVPLTKPKDLNHKASHYSFQLNSPISPIKQFFMKSFQKMKEINTKDSMNTTTFQYTDTVKPMVYSNPKQSHKQSRNLRLSTDHEACMKYKLSALADEKMAIDQFLLDLENNSEINGALIYYLHESTSTIPGNRS